jgi:uncharacterized protein YprB with RNaseH-like and TPR domain
MIKNSFIFLPKIRSAKEKSIWAQGIKDWDEFIAKDRIKGISSRIKQEYSRLLAEAKKALYEDDSSYFCDTLPTTETWRLYDFFMDEAIFLDIETSSATSQNSYLTVIGLFDGIDTKTMIRDVNLDTAALKRELAKYRLIITFNGSTFDIPYLNKKFPGLIPDVPFIDLRHLCSRVGLKGGLKDIERQLGIARPNIIIERMYGGDPFKLWRMFKGSGDDYYLKLLVEYNEEDVINLKKITEHSIMKLKHQYSEYLTKLI